MGCMIPIPEGEIGRSDWFSRSYEAVVGMDEWTTWRQQDRAYQRTYGVKLHYGPAQGWGIKPVIAVEFPTEAAALLFLLVWA